MERVRLHRQALDTISSQCSSWAEHCYCSHHPAFLVFHTDLPPSQISRRRHPSSGSSQPLSSALDCVPSDATRTYSTYSHLPLMSSTSLPFTQKHTQASLSSKAPSLDSVLFPFLRPELDKRAIFTRKFYPSPLHCSPPHSIMSLQLHCNYFSLM